MCWVSYRCLRGTVPVTQKQYTSTNTQIQTQKQTNTSKHNIKSKKQIRTSTDAWTTWKRTADVDRIFWQCFRVFWERLMSYKSCGTRCVVWTIRIIKISFMRLTVCLQFSYVEDNLVWVDSVAGLIQIRIETQTQRQMQVQIWIQFSFGFVTLSRTWLAYFRHGFHFWGKRAS